MKPVRTIYRQRGMVLFVALVMLVLMLLVAVATFNIGSHNTLIAGNMQNRMEVISSANVAVERLISSPQFIATPATPLAGSNKTYFDLNGDGANDVEVTFDPSPCLKAKSRDMTKQDVCALFDYVNNGLAYRVPVDKNDPSKGFLFPILDCMGGGSGSGGNSEYGIDIQTDATTATTAQTCNEQLTRCVFSLWEITANARDSVTAAASTVVAGVNVSSSDSDFERDKSDTSRTCP